MKVLIVDDEMIIREGISKVIDWGKEGFEMLKPAESAEEAMERIPVERPDILFTDIRMNGKSGLELAKETKVAYPDLQVVILSGYDEFQYAQQALRDGVSDYLLKTCQPDEILRAAHRMRQVILDQQNRLGGPRLLEKLLLTKQELSTKEQESLLKCYPALKESVDGKYPLQVLIVAVDDAPDVSQSQIYDQLEQALGNVIVEDGHQWICVVRALHAAERPGSRLVELERKLRIRLISGSGGAAVALNSLNRSWSEAVAALEFHWILKGERHIAFEQIANRKGIRTLCSQEEEVQLIGMLKSGNPQEAKQWAAELLELLRRDPQLTPASLQTFLQSIVIAGYRWLERVADSLGKSGQVSTTKEQSEAASRPFSEEAFAEQLIRMMEMYNLLSSGKTSHVQKVIEYVRENLDSHLSLGEVSRHVHIHPTYLSEMFKRETGENFSEFVVRKRMEEAMTILRETPAKIGEVANLVGYSDLKHFKKLFRKHTGQTPSGFRGQS
ncbi:response regulator [Paenibacillus brevis]|uniref:Response regulator n=1 Tax=Paenibacillus brevis TaxID=2841508 RepID=A0ABS6FLW2_9BACL|nr:response regulator [Paenibacillus brevis]MBU5671180.1 response regulator [Paenibacillus brevis]